MASLASRSHADDGLHFESLMPVRLGMPEMCATGLSENWLWKACGHRHWSALASAHGLDRPDFRDEQGRRLYAAFTSVSLSCGALDAVAEHAQLDFMVDLRRTGRSRFGSRMRVMSQGATIADMAIESVFIARVVAGENRSARRGLVARPCGLLAPTTPSPPFRPDQWSQLEGFRRADREELATHLLDPSPDDDFNGVGFLYCAAYQAMIDRAEWAWFRRSGAPLTTDQRQVFYLGNAELGDRVRATLCGRTEQDGGLSTWVELARESDGGLIAVAFTRRRQGRQRAY